MAQATKIIDFYRTNPDAVLGGFCLLAITILTTIDAASYLMGDMKIASSIILS
jgi:hypothetical protein